MNDPYWPSSPPSAPNQAQTAASDTPGETVALPASEEHKDLRPVWGWPAVFLGFAGFFVYSVEAGLVLFAMVLSIFIIPIVVVGILLAGAVFVRFAFGKYRGHLSWLGLALWALVGGAYLFGILALVFHELR